MIPALLPHPAACRSRSPWAGLPGRDGVCARCPQRSVPVIVAASTECFLDLSLAAALDRLADLEYTSVELAMFEDADQLKPSLIAADVETAIATCRNSHRLQVVGFDLRIAAQ